MSDMNIVTRIDSYITNFSMPWEKKSKKTNLADDTVSTVGALQHVKIEVKSQSSANTSTSSAGNHLVTPTWAKTYGSQTNILHWCDEQSTLYLGLDIGTIHRYQCTKEKQLVEMKELPEITVHNNQMRIMGISVDPRINHMFSISESGYLIVTDLNNTTTEGGRYITS